MKQAHWIACTGAFALMSALAVASEVSVSSQQVTNGSDVQTVTTITVTPTGTEQIRDFHFYPTSSKKRGTGTIGMPGQGEPGSGWSSSGGGTERSPYTLKAPNGQAPALGGALVFTITNSGAPTSQSWSTITWTTSSNAAPTTPSAGGTGYVHAGQTDGSGSGQFPGQIPIKGISLTGPDVILLADTGVFLAEAGLDEASTLSYSVFATLALDPIDPSKVDKTDPVPSSWNLELSTNCRTGTTHVAQGVISATWYGDGRNHVLVSVPDQPELAGQSFYLQVEYGDGEITAPVLVTLQN